MNLPITKSLPINIDSFGFFTREIKDGKYIKNRCGRDFLYYTLHYYYPQTYNPETLNPIQIEKSGVFGLRLPSWLVWTGLSFYKIPRLLSSHNLILEINDRRINVFTDFILALLGTRVRSADEALKVVKETIDHGNVCGIDIAVALGGLVDHVMFVYGYDENNLYVFDTHQATKLSYRKMTDESDTRYIMKLPFEQIRKGWNRFNRVWIIKRQH